MKKLIIILFLMFVIIFGYHYLTQKNIIETDGNLGIVSPEPNTIGKVVEPAEEPEVVKNVSMVFSGDIMCHNTQFKDAYKNGTYDFSYVFDDVKDYISTPDVAVGNLETTFAGAARGYNGYPQFNSPEQLATNLKDVGFDILTTANNHSLDTGYAGIEGTLNELDKISMAHTGTSRSEEEQNTILYHEVNGLKIAFIASTYGTNGIPVPSGKSYCINLQSEDFLLSQIEKAKEGNPDIIVACMHWGTEYVNKYIDSQVTLANLLFENGVDIIIGNHPHVLEPMETRHITTKDGKEKDVFLVYSLGNFMSGQTQKYTTTSILLNLDVSKSNKKDSIILNKVSYIPIYTYTSPKFKNYKILNINKAISEYDAGNKYVSADAYNTMKQEIKRLSEMYPGIPYTE